MELGTVPFFTFWGRNRGTAGRHVGFMDFGDSRIIGIKGATWLLPFLFSTIYGLFLWGVGIWCIFAGGGLMKYELKREILFSY